MRSCYLLLLVFHISQTATDGFEFSGPFFDPFFKDDDTPGGPTEAPITPTTPPSTKPPPFPTVSPAMSSTTAHPSPSPTSTPTKKTTSAPPTKPPSEPPTLAPTKKTSTQQPSFPPVQNIAPWNGQEVLLSTQKSTHEFQWGQVTESCEYTLPPVVLSCGGGGFLEVLTMKNADCEELNVDYQKCEAEVVEGEDSHVTFTCTGITHEHLTARAQIFPSQSVGCSKQLSASTTGGGTLLFGTLGRFCRNTTDGSFSLENRFSCLKGMQLSQEGVTFCVTGNDCETDESSCNVVVEEMEMSDPETDERCREPETVVDLESFDFVASKLASYHVVDWKFSGQDLGCEWNVPDLILQCANGGDAALTNSHSFCQDTGDSVTCSNPVPNSSEKREGFQIHVWCYGDSASQLALSANLPAVTNGEASCQYSGLAIQGIALNRSCGGNGFYMVSDPSFCLDSSDIHPDTNLCWSGDLCNNQESGCDTVNIAAVSTGTSSPAVTNCLYAGLPSN